MAGVNEIAVLADIHSNHVALECCMNYAIRRGIRQFLFLGDYIGEFAYPERTMELLRKYAEEYDCTFIRGNKENYWLNYKNSGTGSWHKYDSTTGALYYAYQRLTERDLRFFSGLSHARKLQYGSLPTVLICHGSPADVRGNMLPGNAETKRVLESADVDLVLYAHTHIQGKTVHAGKCAINPGSVGVPLKSGAKTQFMILRATEMMRVGDRSGCATARNVWETEFVSLEYDRERVIRELYESGLAERAPYWCKITELLLRDALPDGIAHARLLERAMYLCEQETGICRWPQIPEKYWERAVGEYC